MIQQIRDLKPKRKIQTNYVRLQTVKRLLARPIFLRGNAGIAEVVVVDIEMIPIKVGGAFIEPGDSAGGNFVGYAQADSGGRKGAEFLIAGEEVLCIQERKKVRIKIRSSLVVYAVFHFK